MSQIRQQVRRDPAPGRLPVATPEFLVRTFACGYSSGTVLEPHSHDWAQLAYASEGVMRVETDHGIWVVPSHRAVWIPAGVVHSIGMSGRVAMRTLYLEPSVVSALPARCCVFAVPPLLRELILHAVGQRMLRADSAAHRRLVEFLLDQIAELPVAPLELPMPADPRAQRLAARLRAHPEETDSLDALARGTGASRRTQERLFQGETGLSLGRWRAQARLLHALSLLAAGSPVTQVALDVGYESPSAFIAAFSSAFGTTPGRYYRAGRA